MNGHPYDEILKKQAYEQMKLNRDVAWESWKEAKGFDNLDPEDKISCDHDFSIWWGRWAVR